MKNKNFTKFKQNKKPNMGNFKKPVFSNPVLSEDGVNINKATRDELSKIHRQSRSICLWGVDNAMPVAELLVAVSWRDTIISVPRAIVPDGHGTYKLFQLDDNGHPRKPTTEEKSYAVAFLDACHLKDRHCKLERTRWSVVRIIPRGKQIAAYYFYDVPDKAATDHRNCIRRNALNQRSFQYAVPVFEVNSEDWYYKALLHRLGKFINLGQSVLANNMLRYYQYLNMSLGGFIEMYSYVPREEGRPQEAAVRGFQTPQTINDTIQTFTAAPLPKKPQEVKVEQPIDDIEDFLLGGAV